MKQEPSPRSHRIAALFAAAAFLPTPLFAQDTTQQTPPVLADPSPPVTTTPPVVVPPSPAPAETPPVAATPPPAEQARPPLLTQPLPAEEPAAQRAQRQAPRATRTARTAPRAAPRPRAEAPAARAVQARPAPAEAPAPEAAAPAPAPAEAIPPADAPPAAAPIAAADPAPAAPAEERQSGGMSWLWLLAGGALLLGAVALLLRRRRRHAVHEQESYEPAHHHEEPAAAAFEPAREVEHGPVHDSVHAPVAAAGLGAAAAPEGGRPWLELLMRPVRAGVDGQDAVVEFELSVDNQGNAPARDVRISTWMFAAGSGQESEMERMLIERPANASIPEGTIDPGDARRIATAVALPTAGLQQDAVLPVVVADARYVLPDGSEGHTSASFAVGVPYGEELAHFALDNPSGLHEHVEARPLGEPERD